MLYGPRIDEAQLVSRVAQQWEIDVDGLGPILGGEDSHAWAYEVHGPTSYFLKVRLGAVDPATVLVPRYLRDHGLPGVVAPIPTADGTPYHQFDGYGLLLYPFMAGASAARRGLSDVQWIEYGRFLSELHAVELPAELATIVPTEAFRPAKLRGLHAVSDRVRQGGFDTAAQRSVARLWRERAGLIDTIARRTAELAPLVAARGRPHVLCHADIHRANLIVADNSDIHIVDWDETMLAPRERDLMFVIGSGIAAAPPTGHQESLFWQGYGKLDIDRPTLAYYRYEWAVQDLADFARRVFFRDDLSEKAKDAAAAMLGHLFDSGDEVDMALRSDLD
jgi:spectinomycin phosphotransferase